MQVDIRGDAYGMLAAHPVAPLVSLHHLDHIQTESAISVCEINAKSPQLYIQIKVVRKKF